MFPANDLIIKNYHVLYIYLNKSSLLYVCHLHHGLNPSRAFTLNCWVTTLCIDLFYFCKGLEWPFPSMNQQIAKLVFFAVCFVYFFDSSGLLLFVVVYHLTAIAPHYNFNEGGYRPYYFFSTAATICFSCCFKNCWDPPPTIKFGFIYWVYGL